jgi:TPP-dependent pyruvate/acetoin dehydrogenase alpha subunit
VEPEAVSTVLTPFMREGGVELPKELILSLYRSMVRQREFELKLRDVYRSGVMPGFIHLYIGQEAVAAGVCAHLDKKDYVTSTHRGHGHALAKGVPMGELFAEIWGKTKGSNGGRGGSMHIYDPDSGFLGTNGIVAANIPIGAGAALAAKLRGSPQVTVSFFGDGAVNNCAFHEGMNLAAAWDLPVVYVCENNLYATETPFNRVTKNTDVSTRGAAYGMPGMSVDGNDVVQVYEAARDAIAGARAGRGPTLIECKTYRVGGHFEGDPGIGYRTKEEIEQWRSQDPIIRFRQRAIAESLDPAQLSAIDQEAAHEVAEAYKFAASSPDASPATVADFVYS